MALNLIARWKARRAVGDLERHPVYGPVLRYARPILNDESQGIDKVWSKDGKRTLLGELLSDPGPALNNPNPAQAVRMRTIEFMLVTAQFDVLVVQPPTPFPLSPSSSSTEAACRGPRETR